MADLHVWNNDGWLYIAESAEEAARLDAKDMGVDPNPEEWSQWPDDKPIRFATDSDEHAGESRLPAGWIAKFGKGFLGGPEQ